MTTLPNPTPCPSCIAPEAWRAVPGHESDRETLAPVVLPNRAALAGWLLGPLTTFKRSGTPGGEFQIADEVIRFLTEYTHHWVPVEPGTKVEKGQRYRIEYVDGDAYERTAGGSWDVHGDGTTVYVLRTVPAPTLTERIRAACNDSPESRITLDVADVEALLDMAGGEDK